MVERTSRSNGALWTAVWLGAGAVVSTALGFALGQAWLLPFVGAAVPFPVFLRHVRARRYAGAVGWMLLWALFQSVAVGIAVWFFPDRAAQVVHRGPEYTVEMMGWVRTGEGPEGSPRLYLPIHVRHYLGFCVLSVVTLGAAALTLGTWLLNYMNYYVVELARASADTRTALLLGWPVWAAIRVVGFIVTGTALTALGLSLAGRIRHRETPLQFPVRVFLIGFGLVVADAVLKWLLPPTGRGSCSRPSARGRSSRRPRTPNRHRLSLDRSHDRRPPHPRAAVHPIIPAPCDQAPSPGAAARPIIGARVTAPAIVP